MTMAPATATIYTNQWVRISGRLRPSISLLAVGFTSLLLGAAAELANQDWVVAIEAFCIGLVVGSALVIALWRRGAATEINLGSQQVRFGKVKFTFADVSDLDLHVSSGNLYLVTDEQKVLLPLFWLGHDQVKVIERMVRLLENPQLPEGRTVEIRDHLLDLLSD